MIKKKNWKLFVLPIIILSLVVIALASNSKEKTTQFQQDKGMVFGTVYSIIYQYDTSLKKEIDETLKSVDASLSMFNQESIIARVNRNEEVLADDHLLNVYAIAEEVNRETFGAFDVTVAPLVNAWGFGFKNGSMPDDACIDSICSFVGMDKLSLDRRTIVKKDNRVMVDFSAIAKGYGVDAVAALLQSKGIENFMVEIGGEIVAGGLNSKNMPWKIGVVKPEEDSLGVESKLQTCINVTDQAMATSGNYRNYYYRDGKKYAHTIDPKTGHPVQHNILSATVFAPNCATADAYATSFMVLGLDGTKKVLARHPELSVYLIYSDTNGRNAIWFSPSLEDKLDK